MNLNLVFLFFLFFFSHFLMSCHHFFIFYFRTGNPYWTVQVAQVLTSTVRSDNSGSTAGFGDGRLACPWKPDTGRPLTDFMWPATGPLPVVAGHLRKEQIANVQGTRTGLSLSYGSAVGHFHSWDSGAANTYLPFPILVRSEYFFWKQDIFTFKSFSARRMINLWHERSCSWHTSTAKSVVKGIVYLLHGILNWNNSLIELIFVELDFKSFVWKLTIARDIEHFLSEYRALIVFSCLFPVHVNTR